MAAPSQQRSPDGATQKQPPATPNDNVGALKEPPPPAAVNTAATAVAASSPASSTASAAGASVAAAAASSSLPSGPITYDTTQASDTYQTAMTLMQAGEFEPAMTLLEQAIQHTLERLTTATNATSDNGNNNSSTSTLPLTPDEAAIHPALAPLHYLYGTTLLYSLEENTASASAMMMQQGNEGDDNAEDAQIAYENLETARVLLERYIAEEQKGSDHDCQKKESDSNPQLSLDLAQIHLRLGDLHRLNGSHAAALPEYQACLQLRQAHAASLENQQWSRKIADAHYNLALTYSLLSCELSHDDNDGQGAAGGTAPANAQERRDEYRSLQFVHYEQCAQILAAQLAHAAGHNVEQFLEQATKEAPETTAPAAAGLKRNDKDEQLHATAQRLQGLRQAVGQLTVTDADLFATLTELLDEILETVLEARHSEEGVQQVTALKQQMQAAVAAQGDAAADPSGMATHNATSAAAGASTTTTEPSNDTPAFGSAAAAAVSATAQQPTTMMVRKKKKKRPAPADNDVKMPPAKKKPPPPTE